MKNIHVPTVNARYWLAITFASIFGTNLGDFYAHESGLGIGLGLLVLTALAATVFIVERFDNQSHEIYYWLVIIIIRTGATNIADFLAFRMRIPALTLSLALVTVLALLALLASRSAFRIRLASGRTSEFPKTGKTYWLAMLDAGVLGTVIGDICSHAVGQGFASLGLSAILGVVLLAGRQRPVLTIGFYWLTVAVARTAGTALGDLVAENKTTHIGLPLSTLSTGCVFIAILWMWRNRQADPRPPSPTA